MLQSTCLYTVPVLFLQISEPDAPIPSVRLPHRNAFVVYKHKILLF